MRGWNIERIRWATGLLLIAGLMACGAPDRPTEDAGAPDPLTGIWYAEFVLTQPMLGRADSAEAGTARGRIALVRENRVRDAEGLGGVPTHVGTHAVVLRRFGFEPRHRGVVPGVIARWIEPDSVELAFESPNRRETFITHGHLAGDSISGRWHYSTRVTGAAGRVVLRRVP